MLPERLCLRFACRFFFLRSSAFRALTVLRAMEVGYFRTGGNATPSSDCFGKVEVAAIDPKSEIERLETTRAAGKLTISLTAGTHRGHFEITEPIGNGGMLEVYKAKDIALTAPCGPTKNE